VRVKKNGFINYFGKQRFGIRGNTHLVGKEILKNDIKEAVWIYLTHGGEEKEEFRKFRENLAKTRDFKLGLKECPRNLRNEIVLLNHLVSKPNDYAGALRRIPKKFRRMFVHAYQSYLWNEIAKFSEESSIPVIGFMTDLVKYKSSREIKKILESEGIDVNDFKTKSMPELSSEGDERERVIKPKNLKWSFGNDELNKGKIKCTLGFEIPKGSYATVLIEEVLR
jgi:tRNA pseudouridine13 synthase